MAIDTNSERSRCVQIAERTKSREAFPVAYHDSIVNSKIEGNAYFRAFLSLQSLAHSLHLWFASRCAFSFDLAWKEEAQWEHLKLDILICLFTDN